MNKEHDPYRLYNQSAESEDDAPEWLEKFLEQTRPNVERLACRALNDGCTNDEYIIVSIQSDDPYWTELAKAIFDNSHAADLSGDKEGPVFYMVVDRRLCEILVSIFPDQEEDLLYVPENSAYTVTYTVLALVQGGGLVVDTVSINNQPTSSRLN
jgi:hypothetical protein